MFIGRYLRGAGSIFGSPLAELGLNDLPGHLVNRRGGVISHLPETYFVGQSWRRVQAFKTRRPISSGFLGGNRSLINSLQKMIACQCLNV